MEREDHRESSVAAGDRLCATVDVGQVRQNTESTQRQYGLATTAAELGWLAEQIVVVDADLGVSGRFGSEREGYREIVTRLCIGEVGAVFGLQVSRLGRSNADLSRLMELARLTDTRGHSSGLVTSPMAPCPGSPGLAAPEPPVVSVRSAITCGPWSGPLHYPTNIV